MTTKVTVDGGGLRYNSGKPRFDLIPADGLRALARHYTRGAEKYADRNWERGMDWSKCFASLERHVWAWMGGEDFDPETGSHHMIAVAWNALALAVYSFRKIGNDDRPTPQEQAGTDGLSTEDRARAACLGQGPEFD